MAGWIKLYRDLQDHWLSHDYEKLGWWVDLLFLASYKDSKKLIGNRIVELKRGQLDGSISFFMDRWHTTKDKVINYFKLLQLEGMVDKKTDRNVTIVTICKYESYQDSANNLSDNLSYYLPDNLPDTNKEIKEVKEINITTTAHAHTRTCEEYAQRYRAENNWQELGLMLHTSIESCQSLFSEFVSFQKHDGKAWNDYNDFKRHFRIWAQKRILEKPKTPTKPKVKTNADILKEFGL